MRPADHADFDTHALYEALNAARQQRDLSWLALAREINRRFEGAPARPISPSTLTGWRVRAKVEADGVLQALRWLERSPESFVPDSPRAGTNEPLLDPGPSWILRFDTQALYRALDTERAARSLSWSEVAAEVRTTPGQLRALSRGGRTAFPDVMRLTRWLGRPATEFTRASDR